MQKCVQRSVAGTPSQNPLAERMGCRLQGRLSIKSDSLRRFCQSSQRVISMADRIRDSKCLELLLWNFEHGSYICKEAGDRSLCACRGFGREGERGQTTSASASRARHRSCPAHWPSQPLLQKAQRDTCRETNSRGRPLNRTDFGKQFTHRVRTHGKNKQVRGCCCSSQIGFGYRAELPFQEFQFVRVPIVNDNRPIIRCKAETCEQRACNSPSAEKNRFQRFVHASSAALTNWSTSACWWAVLMIQ